MNKPPFIEEMEKRLREEERVFKFRSAELCGARLVIELLVDCKISSDILNDALIDKICDITAELVPPSVESKVQILKVSNDENSVIKHLLEYIYKEKPTIFSGFQEAPIEVKHGAGVVYVKIILEKYLYEYAVNSGLKEELEQYLSLWLMEEADISFEAVPNQSDKVKLNVRPQERISSLRTINTDITQFFSGTIAMSPRYIADVCNKEHAQVCLCGVLSDIKPHYIEKIDKTLYTFQLYDTTGKIKVKYFAKKQQKFDWNDVIKDGMTLIMLGQIKHDNYDAGLVFFPRSIAQCTIDYSSINIKSDYLSEAKEYVRIFPQPIGDGRQGNLLDGAPNPDLLKNEFVVFDVETTGLDQTKDKIIELAAIKIRDGEICESFDCLINPEIELPEEIVELTHITDEMLVNSYKIGEIIGDFYKFTRGAILVAHNAPFDMGFLTIAGRENKYDFDNAYMDTLAMARQKLKLRSNKLESLCNHFNIPLVGAHRAINDTLATAKLFIELMNLSK